MVIETNARLELSQKAAALTDRYESFASEEVLKAAFLTEFVDEICLVSSFGADAVVLLHMVATIDRDAPIIFLDTLKHFRETLVYRDSLTESLKLTNVKSVTPCTEALNADDPDNLLVDHDPDLCCHIRKTLPMSRALNPYRCWITGRKKFQSTDRTKLQLFEAQDGRIKINPLCNWDPDRIEDYCREHSLPKHPLRDQGYLSIGCAPCTRAVDSTENSRSGRWSGLAKTECGIHLGNDEGVGHEGQ